MLSDRTKRIAYWSSLAIAGLGSASLFTALWLPFFSFPEEQDVVAMSYGIIPLGWTMAAFAAGVIGFLIALLLPLRISVSSSVLLLAGSVWLVVWWLSPMMKQSFSTFELLLVGVAGALLLLPPFLTGWLAGNGLRRSRTARAAVEKS